MKVIRYILATTLSFGLLAANANLFAHGSDSGGAMNEFMVTRHFTGSWEQVDEQSQGLSLEVIEQLDAALHGAGRVALRWTFLCAIRRE